MREKIVFLTMLLLMSWVIACGDDDKSKKDADEPADTSGPEDSDSTDENGETDGTDDEDTDSNGFVFDPDFVIEGPFPVDTHGQLRVDGNRIVGEHGDPVMLMGMSLYWSVWGPQKYYNDNVVRWLIYDWKINLIRAAMAVDIDQSGNNKGWLFNPEVQTNLVETVVDSAIENGIYVIVDWHSHEIYTDEAKEFFGYMAEKYGNTPNIIWEIYNEPTRQSWEDIKEYSEAVIAVIREHSDNLVVAGTRNWSQFVDEASEDPIDDDNTAYSLHFYAGTHTQSLRNRAQTALDNGVALFITEWGTSSADGGRNDEFIFADQSDIWIEWARERHISMANWSLGDVSEMSAALVPITSIHGGWDPETDLTDAGRFVRDWIIEINSEE